MYDVIKWGNFDKKYNIDPTEGKFVAIEKIEKQISEIESELERCDEGKKEELEERLVHCETALYLVKERDFEDMLSGLPSTVGSGETVQEIYLSGLREKKAGNFDEAARLLKEARNLGSVEASVTLGTMAEDGTLFGEPDMDAARTYYEDGGEEGLKALENFDERYETVAEEKRSRNFKELDEVAASGEDLQRMEELFDECGISEYDKVGYCLKFYRSSDDKEKYYEFLEKSAEQGSEEAKKELAEHYIFDCRTADAGEKALKLAEELSEKNVPESSYYLGFIYADGKGTVRDDDKATEYLSKYLSECRAAHDKYAVKCEERLGDIYFVKSMPDIKNIELAKEYYQKALEGGSSTAQEKIVSCDEELADIKRTARARVFKLAAAAAILLALVATIRFSYKKYTSEAQDAKAAESSKVESTISEEAQVSETAERETTEASETEASEASEVSSESEETDPYAFSLIEGDYEGDAIEIKHLTASSTLESKDGQSYGPENMIDDDLETCWQEGDEGTGVGTVIGIELGEAKDVSAISFNVGNQEKEEKFSANNRPKKVNIVIKGVILPVEFADKMETQTVVFDKPINADRISVEITDVYKGSLYNDTCISGIKVH